MTWIEDKQRQIVILVRDWCEDCECHDCEHPDVEVAMPTKVEVCSTCNGKGTHVNSAIDGNGLTHEELYGDPDFAEDYFAGV
jgi:DnaJ-class molecular chaperone